VPPVKAAKHYLVDDGRAAAAAHQAAVQSAILIARRAGLGSRWRLLRMQLPAALPAPVGFPALSLEEWAESEGLEDWPMAEQQALFAERFGTPEPADPRAARKARQAERLRLARLALLRELDAYAVDTPALTDPVAGWFPDELVRWLEAAGFHTLAGLQAAIAIGGRWWRGLPAYGPKKALALAQDVQALVGIAAPPRWTAARVGPELDGRHGSNRGQAPRIDAGDDRAAIETWINARTQSAQTARAYRREAERFLLWLLVERGRPLSGAEVDDCRDYMDFLAHVPPEWMSRRAARRLETGWAPFARQPDVNSQRYALTILGGLFAWLTEVDYLRANPWKHINTRLPDDPAAAPIGSRAFSPAAWQALTAHLPALDPPAAARMRWLLTFAQATGLRAAELLRACRADLVRDDEGYSLRVHGKGARNRLVPVPEIALQATRQYFDARGLAFDAVHPVTPLLAILARPELPGFDVPAPDAPAPKQPDAQERRQRGYLSYSTLAPAFRRFVRGALAASSLGRDEIEAARAASLHWLRHTHATRLVEAAGGGGEGFLREGIDGISRKARFRRLRAKRAVRADTHELLHPLSAGCLAISSAFQQHVVRVDNPRPESHPSTPATGVASTKMCIKRIT